MKSLLLVITLSLALTNAGFAQETMLAAVPQASATTHGNDFDASTAPALSDSARQVVHKLYKRARLYGAIAAVSGGLVLGSGTGYAIAGESFRNTGFSIVGGAIALVVGTKAMVQFSRRREREVLAALERGQPLPPYAVQWLPIIGK